jgi:hypothetical protein
MACFLIDFDDGGFGFRLFDLATTANRLDRHDPTGGAGARLLQGYLATRALDLTHLPLFRALRAMTYVGWVITRLHEPGARRALHPVHCRSRSPRFGLSRPRSRTYRMTQATSPLSQVPSKAEVVVIGGGIIGVSTLYHLAKKGVDIRRSCWNARPSPRARHGMRRGSSGNCAKARARPNFRATPRGCLPSWRSKRGRPPATNRTARCMSRCRTCGMEQLRRNHDHAGRMGIESHLLTARSVSERFGHLRRWTMCWAGSSCPRTGR